MSLYQCEQCGCKENTACGWYHYTEHTDLKYNRRKLCSACAPTNFSDGTPTDFTGEWHGDFQRTFYPKGVMMTNRVGNLDYKPKFKSHPFGSRLFHPEFMYFYIGYGWPTLTSYNGKNIKFAGFNIYTPVKEFDPVALLAEYDLKERNNFINYQEWVKRLPDSCRLVVDQVCIEEYNKLVLSRINSDTLDVFITNVLSRIEDLNSKKLLHTMGVDEFGEVKEMVQ